VLAFAAQDRLLVAGETEGLSPGTPSVGEWDTYLLELNPETGAERWFVQYGTTGQEYVRDMVLDSSGFAYIVGNTDGSFLGGAAQGGEGFILKVEADGGALIDARMVASPGDDEARRVVIDSSGWLWVAGTTTGGLATPSYGEEDAYVSRLDPQSMEFLSVAQFGSPRNDRLVSLAMGPTGQMYLAGFTTGGVGFEDGHGGEDVFVARVAPTGTSLEAVLQFGGAGDDRVTYMTVAPNGDLLLAGVVTTEMGVETYLMRLIF
jgi:hypothetical protein